MSSIFGKLHLDNRPVTTPDLDVMRVELNHWNADHTDVWANGPVGLGCLTLYNTPESLHEKLPLHDLVSGLSITADARIDNREELYPRLGMTTAGEKSLSDGSMLLRMYRKFGEECVLHIVGDFAFAIWDSEEKKLFCARDHMGVKPLFYYLDHTFFAFATEKKGLLPIPNINKDIDKQFFYNQLIWPPVQAADTTLYEKIKRLPPAHTLTFYAANNKLQLRRYWTLNAYKETRLARKEDYYEGLQHHIEKAVQCRLRSHYPIGAELSGGLDSSAITGVATHFLKTDNRQLITFSNTDSGDPEPIKAMYGEDERKYIDAVINFNSIRDSVLVKEDIWDNPLDEADFYLKVNDGLEMMKLLWQMPIKKAATERSVRTLLSGFPGDEMVTYRGQFQFLDYLEKKQYLKYFSAKSEFGFKKVKPFLPPGIEFIFHKMKNVLSFNDETIKNISDFIKIPAKYRYTRNDLAWKDPNYLERFKSHRHYQKYRLLKTEVPLRMEAETRYGIAFRLEPRFPMADIRLTQFYLSMPNNLKSEGDMSRNAYRMAIGKYLPELVLNRDNKSGSIAPFRIGQNTRQREEAILKIINSINTQQGHANKAISHSNINNKLFRYIEVLRWMEKNLKNIME